MNRLGSVARLSKWCWCRWWWHVACSQWKWGVN